GAARARAACRRRPAPALAAAARRPGRPLLRRDEPRVRVLRVVPPLAGRARLARALVPPRPGAQERPAPTLRPHAARGRPPPRRRAPARVGAPAPCPACRPPPPPPPPPAA